MKLAPNPIINPTMPKRTTNPVVTVRPTSTARPICCIGRTAFSGSPASPRYIPRYAGSMANPHGLTAEAIPAASANNADAPTRPPSQELESPDNRSTNRFTSSIPLSLPMMRAPMNAVARATAATTTGRTTLRIKLGLLKLIALLMS